jgi:hypothetical protein
MKLVILVGAALAMTASPALAYFCSEPSAPYCANSYGAFSDGYQFEDCKREMRSYADEIDSYLSCLAEESQSAVDDYNDAVQSFNRRAGGY